MQNIKINYEHMHKTLEIKRKHNHKNHIKFLKTIGKYTKKYTISIRSLKKHTYFLYTVVGYMKKYSNLLTFTQNIQMFHKIHT